MLHALFTLHCTLHNIHTYVLNYAVSLGIVCVLVIAGAICAGCAVKIKKGWKVTPSTVVYEDPEAAVEFVIKTNECYEEQHIYCEIENVISMKENHAYGTAEMRKGKYCFSMMWCDHMLDPLNLADLIAEPPSPQPSIHEDKSRNSTINE